MKASHFALCIFFLLSGFMAGAVAGHFHGKAETLEKFTFATAEMMASK